MLGIVTSFSSKFLIDYILKNKFMTTLTVMVAGMVILEIIQMLLSIFRGYLLIFLGQRINIAILLGYYNHVIKLPMNFFSTRKTGEITSRFSDADNINDAVAEMILTLMLDVITAITGGIIVYIHQYLFFVSIVILLLYVVIVFSFKEILKKINNDVLENNSQLTSFIIQSINGIETIKAYNLEKSIQDETEFKYLKVIKSSFKRSKIYNLLTFLSGVVGLTGNILIIM